MMDTDNSGAITFDELKAGLQKLGSGLMDNEVRIIMEAVIDLPCLCFELFSCIYLWFILLQTRYTL